MSSNHGKRRQELTASGYIRIFRPGDVAVGILAIVLSAVAAAGTGVADRMQEVVITAVAVVLYVCGGNAFNDSLDGDVDSTAHPDRPIPVGAIDPGMAKLVGIGLMLVSAAVSILLLGGASAAIVAAACILLVLYELLLKRLGPIGNVTIAIITGMSVLLGGFSGGDPVAVIWLTAMVFTVTLGREIYKDMADIEGDRIARVTLPMKVGPEAAGLMAALFYIVACAICLMRSFSDPVYYAGIIPAAVAVYGIAHGWSDPDRADTCGKVCLLLLMLISAAAALY